MTNQGEKLVPLVALVPEAYLPKLDALVNERTKRVGDDEALNALRTEKGWTPEMLMAGMLVVMALDMIKDDT